MPQLTSKKAWTGTGFILFLIGGFNYQNVEPMAELDELFGTATYKGLAVGLYVVDSDWGEFMASANLETKFSELSDGNRIANHQSDTWIVAGTIEQFQSVTGTHYLGDRSLNLNNADLIAGLSITTVVNNADLARNLVGNTSGGDGISAGTWSGRFIGGDDGADRIRFIAPVAITREFKGNFQNGSVVGAFGAEKTEHNDLDNITTFFKTRHEIIIRN